MSKNEFDELEQQTLRILELQDAHSRIAKETEQLQQGESGTLAEEMSVQTTIRENKLKMEMLKARIKSEASKTSTIYEFAARKQNLTPRQLNHLTKLTRRDEENGPSFREVLMNKLRVANSMELEYTRCEDEERKMRNRKIKRVFKTTETENDTLIVDRAFGCVRNVNLVRFNACAGLVHLLSCAALFALAGVYWDQQFVYVNNLVVEGPPNATQSVTCENNIPFPTVLLSGVFALASAFLAIVHLL